MRADTKLMKALFVHDHNFVINNDKGLVYDGSGGAFDNRLWRRYLEIFDELIVVGREVNRLPNSLVVSSEKNVEFKLYSDLQGVKGILKNKRFVVEELENLINTVDLVIVRLPSSLGTWATQICKRLKKKYVIEVVGDPFEAYWHHGHFLGKIVAPVAACQMRRLVKKSPFVIYVTKNQLQTKYPCANKIESISNVRLDSKIEEGKVKEFYSQKREKFIVGMIGSFHVKYKGHKEAIKALQQLVNRGINNIELKIVGSGNGSWVLKLAKEYGVLEYVNIIGVLPSGNEGVFPFLDGIDLYIHPSLTEGLPRVVIEAMSRGKICLISNAGGASELLDDHFIHKAGDWKKLGEQMEWIYNQDKSVREEIALSNLMESFKYQEGNLQDKRVSFFRDVVLKFP